MAGTGFEKAEGFVKGAGGVVGFANFEEDIAFVVGNKVVHQAAGKPSALMFGVRGQAQHFIFTGKAGLTPDEIGDHLIRRFRNEVVIIPEGPMNVLKRRTLDGFGCRVIGGGTAADDNLP